jgi:sulfur carrier protein
MELHVNGRPGAVEPGTSVLEYLRANSLDPLRVAVEINMHIVKRDRFGATLLNEGDRVEIVQFVGGG